MVPANRKAATLLAPELRAPALFLGLTHHVRLTIIPAMTDRANLIPLTNIRVEVWEGDTLQRTYFMNYAKPEKQLWFRNLHVWAWSNGYTIRSTNTHGQGTNAAIMEPSRDEQPKA